MCGLTRKDTKWYEIHEPAGKRLTFSAIQISYMYVIKSWAYEGNTLPEKFLVPFGMVKTMTSLRSMKKCYHSYVLPVTVKCFVKVTQ